MKKLTFCVLATFLMLSVIPDQSKAATDAKADRTISTETVNSTDQLTTIQPIDLTTLNTSEDKEVLKEASQMGNEQGRHNGRYNNRHNHRDVDVTIQTNRHRHSGVYIGGGGALVLILILILVL